MTDKKSFNDQLNDINNSLLKLKEEYEKKRNALRLKKSTVKAKQSKEFRKRRTHYLIQLGSTIDAAIKKSIQNDSDELASWLVTSDTDAKSDKDWQQLYQYLLNDPNIITTLLKFKSSVLKMPELYIPNDSELKGFCKTAEQKSYYFGSWHKLIPALKERESFGDYTTQQNCIYYLASEVSPSVIINVANEFDGHSFASVLASAKKQGFNI